MSHRFWHALMVAASAAFVVGVSFYSAMGFPPPLR
jgi:hypothetical protein